MDDAQATLRSIGDELDELADAVEAALDEHATFKMGLETRVRVEDVTRRYRELVAGLDEKGRFAADRTIGRKLTDVLRMATRLPAPAVGQKAEKRVDTGFFETRAPTSSRPPITIGAIPGGLRPRDGKPKVADEIEAWCGRCFSLRTHIIAAVVGDHPAKVVCQSCRSSSRYRVEPIGGGDDKKRTAKTPPRAVAARERDPRAKEKEELLERLRAADTVRPFSPKERYKTGEVIEHPEHGRGVVENTLPRSLLVRFAGGIKPIKLA